MHNCFKRTDDGPGSLTDHFTDNNEQLKIDE